MNKVFILGNLGADPETRAIQGGSLTNFSVATSYQHGDREQTEWHRVVTFGKLADLCAKYLHKGSKVFVEGHLQTRSWDDNGVKRYSTEVVAGRVEFLDSKKSDDGEIPF